MTGVSARRGLFRGCAGGAQVHRHADALPPELARAFETFRLMVALPDAVDRKSLVAACVSVYDWACGRDQLATATYFAELAAHVLPRVPALATAAGRANRHRGAFERAERWFDRAMMIARKSGDQAAFAEVLLTAGNMAFQRGQYGAARAMFERAYGKGERYHLREMAAAAKHNLLALDFVQKNYSAAGGHAVAAFALYGRDSHRLPYLAHDVAHLWIAERYYDLALRLLLACEPLITSPGEQLKVWANIGHAAAGAGQVDLFYEAWERVSVQARTSSSPHAAEALVSIAEGAQRLGRVAQAAEVAERALEMARQRSHKDAENMALAALSAIRDGGTPAAPPARAPDETRAFAARLLRALG